MIIPKGHRVLVKQERFDEHDEVFASAKKAGIVIETDKNVRYQASVDKGTVVAIGATAWVDFGGTPWAEVGETVLFAKNAGKSVEDPEDPETPFVILNDEDIVAVIKE